MAGFYGDGDYDLAGFGVGIVDRDRLITGETIGEGDILIGLPSTGVHSNGFSLVRKIVLDRMNMKLTDYIDELGMSVGESLLTPTRLYPRPCLPVIRNFTVKGMVHITGGGFYENIPRVLPDGIGVEIDVTAWPRLPVFELLRKWGDVAWPEMYRTFNMGIGMIMIVDAGDASAVMKNLADRNEKAYVIGRTVKAGADRVVLGEAFLMAKKRIVVFASGRGSNAEALYKATKDGAINGEFVGAVCDKPDAPFVLTAKSGISPSLWRIAGALPRRPTLKLILRNGSRLYGRILFVLPDLCVF